MLLFIVIERALEKKSNKYEKLIFTFLDKYTV